MTKGSCSRKQITASFRRSPGGSFLSCFTKSSSLEGAARCLLPLLDAGRGILRLSNHSNICASSMLFTTVHKSSMKRFPPPYMRRMRFSTSQCRQGCIFSSQYLLLSTPLTLATLQSYWHCSAFYAVLTGSVVHTTSPSTISSHTSSTLYSYNSLSVVCGN